MNSALLKINCFQLRKLLLNQNLSRFFLPYICIFWHHFRTGFELKKFLMILRHIEKLQLLSENQRVTFLIIDGTRHWPSASNLFFKKSMAVKRQCPDLQCIEEFVSFEHSIRKVC